MQINSQAMARLKKLSIIATSFHKKNVDVMLSEARRVAKEKKLTVIREVWVPGCLETPLALQRELTKKAVDGAVVLGIIERGETKHGLVMGMAVISKIIDLQLRLKKPVGVGILGPEILSEKIPMRLKPYAKGAVLAVWEMMN